MNIAIILSLVAATIMAIIAVFHAGKKEGKKDIQLEGEKIFNDKLIHLADKNEEISQKYDKLRKNLSLIPDANDVVSSVRTNRKAATKAKTTRDRRYSFKQSGLR